MKRRIVDSLAIQLSLFAVYFPVYATSPQAIMFMAQQAKKMHQVQLSPLRIGVPPLSLPKPIPHHHHQTHKPSPTKHTRQHSNIALNFIFSDRQRIINHENHRLYDRLMKIEHRKLEQPEPVKESEVMHRYKALLKKRRFQQIRDENQELVCRLAGLLGEGRMGSERSDTSGRQITTRSIGRRIGGRVQDLSINSVSLKLPKIAKGLE